MIINGPHDIIVHDEYTEYVVPSGGFFDLRLEEGDSIRNLLINREAAGASARILTWPSRDNLPQTFSLRNVGFKGAQPCNGPYSLSPACRDHGVIENLYLGDGVSGYPTGPHDCTGLMWAPPEHSGHIEMSNIFCRNGVDNAMYLSAPGYNGRGGTFHVKDSYSVDSHITCFRFGGNDTIENCYGRTTGNDHRVLWAFRGGADVEVIDCEFESASGTQSIVASNNSVVRVRNSSYTRGTGTIIHEGGVDHSPSRFIPSGTPTNPEMAASATVSEPTEPDDPVQDFNELLITGELSYPPETNYSFTTEGEIIHTDKFDATIDPEEEITENPDGTWTATGAVANWRDAFDFYGDILAAQADHTARWWLNGSLIDPNDYPDTPEDVPEDPVADLLEPLAPVSTNEYSHSFVVQSPLHDEEDQSSELTVLFSQDATTDVAELATDYHETSNEGQGILHSTTFDRVVYTCATLTGPDFSIGQSRGAARSHEMPTEILFGPESGLTALDEWGPIQFEVDGYIYDWWPENLNVPNEDWLWREDVGGQDPPDRKPGDIWYWGV